MSNEKPNSGDPDQKEFFAFMRTAFVPLIFTKALVLYFGVQYSAYPGEGYGWGLLITISVTLISFAIFIYKNQSAE
jgi:hypothetical protein